MIERLPAFLAIRRHHSLYISSSYTKSRPFSPIPVAKGVAAVGPGLATAIGSGAIGIDDLALGAVAFSIINIAVHTAIGVVGADHVI